MTLLSKAVVEAYAKNANKAPEIISDIPAATNEYFNYLVSLKLEAAKSLFTTGSTLDIGCANGKHLDYVMDGRLDGVGVDITDRYLEYAAKHFPKLSFLKSDVCSLPFNDNCIGGAYSYACLYYIPDFAKAAQEIYRVLTPGSYALLDIGNIRSVTYRLSVEAEPDGFMHCNTHSKQFSDIENAGFKIVKKRYFQILPYWGSATGLRRLLINSRWKKFMQRKIGSKMLDEIVSSLPLFRRYAYRCLVTCQKEKA